MHEKGKGIHLKVVLPHLFNLVKLSLFEFKCVCCENDLILPEEIGVCRSCLAEVEPNDEPMCDVCGRVISRGLDVCGDCLMKPPPFIKHRSYATYENILRQIILIYKYKGISILKKPLTSLLLSMFTSHFKGRFDYVVPVPNDRSRRREFDPVTLIAKRFAKNLNIPLRTDLLKKIKNTPPQALLTQKQRLINLNGAFKLTKKENIRKKRIILLDDVYTTGTTVKKCASLLSGAHADVEAITLARSL